MKIISFNVNGVRAITKKSFKEDIITMDADVICLQETKASVDQTKEALESLKGYFIYGNEAVKKGYSGTAILSRIEPLNVTCDIGIEEFDQEGRVLSAEFEEFIVINVYVPNSGNDLRRLDYRQKWDKAFLDYMSRKNKDKA